MSAEPLFNDDFDGPAGSPPDPAKWWLTPWCSSAGDDKIVCYNPANAYLDGAGCLVLKASAGTMGRPWDAGRAQGFVEGSWPPKKVLASVSPPCRWEALMRMPPAEPGLWAGFWPMGVDGKPPIEIDIQEYRGKVPQQLAFHVHNLKEWSSKKIDLPPDVVPSERFLVYAADVYADRIAFNVTDPDSGRVWDGGTAPVACPQQLSPRLSLSVGPPHTWGGRGGPPPPGDYLMLVDWVRAWPL